MLVATRCRQSRLGPACQADAIAGEGTLVLQADGGRRYVYNPRLIAAARTMQRGTIYDRTGLPLATSNWNELEQHRAEYKALGIDIDKACNRADSALLSRWAPSPSICSATSAHAPTGAPEQFARRTRLQPSACRAMTTAPASCRCKDAAGKPFYTIRYDYRELLPLLRHRWEPDNLAVKRIRDRERNVHLSISRRAAGEGRANPEHQLAEQHLDHGSIVVMDPANGDLLASVNCSRLLEPRWRPRPR